MDDKLHRRNLVFGIIGILAAWACTVSDTLLLYSPGGDYFNPQFDFLYDVNGDYAGLAMLIGGISIPLMAFGIVPVLELLRPAGKTTRLLAIGATVLVILTGLFCHSSFYGLVFSINENSDMVETWIQLTSFSSALFAAVFFIVFGLGAFLLLSGSSNAPRWLIFFNPLATYPIFFLCWLLLPGIGNYLLPTGFNLSVGIFYIGTLVAQEGISKENL